MGARSTPRFPNDCQKLITADALGNACPQTSQCHQGPGMVSQGTRPSEASLPNCFTLISYLQEKSKFPIWQFHCHLPSPCYSIKQHNKMGYTQQDLRLGFPASSEKYTPSRSVNAILVDFNNWLPFYPPPSLYASMRLLVGHRPGLPAPAPSPVRSPSSGQRSSPRWDHAH